MPYYLRIESVNLSYFIDDTNDLSTTRGGGLLLLEAMEKVEGILKKYSPKKVAIDTHQLTQDLKGLKQKKSTKTNKKKIKEIEAELQNASKEPSSSTITKGASWGLFDLEVNQLKAIEIKKELIKAFDFDDQYKHATIVVDLHQKNKGHYQQDRDSLQILNHWQQMQAPSLAICKEGVTSCAIDKVRPASTKRDLKDGTQDFVSDSVNQRREYGVKQKDDFHHKITKIEAKFTKDLTSLSHAPDQGILHGKVAYIYIDGNSFGNIQKGSKNAQAQREFDQNSRQGREQLLTNILTEIHQQADWLTNKDEVRLETLLWGGDEIIWVVPAWQGWWMINEFYKQATQLIQNKNKPLFHAAGLVFCHHNAPIHRINALARNLADQFAKAEEGRKKNYIAYQVLEAFDHAGTQLKAYRDQRVKNLGQWQHLLIEAENLDGIITTIRALKKSDNFGQRKIYQILHAYKNEENDKAEQYRDKLTEGDLKKLNQLKAILGGDKAHWLHLIDLWNYIQEDENASG